MNSIQKMFRYLTLICFLSIIILEIGFRLVRREQWVKHEYPKVYTFDTICGYKGIPNIEGYIRRPSIRKKFKLNNQGFYGADFCIQKPDSVFRIIVVGSSGVEGIWANHKEVFPQKLQKQFKKEGFKIEVINCAISGSDRDLQNIKLIEHYLIKYSPDLVLYEGRTRISTGNYHRDTYKDYSILYAGNNMEERTHSRYIAEQEVERIKQLKIFTDLWDISYILRFYGRRANTHTIPSLSNCLSKYAENKAESWNYSRFKSYTFAESIDILNRLNKTLKNHSCKLVLFHYGSIKKKQLMDIKEKIEFQCIFLNISGENLGHKYDGHFNENAHQIIAEETFAKLKHFLPKEFYPKNHEPKN